MSDRPSSGQPASDRSSSGPTAGVELWLAALDDVAGPLSEIERADPLGRVATEDDGLTGARGVARSLLRRLIARTFGRAVASLPFAAGPHGKPMLAGLGGDFNLAHTTTVDGRSIGLIGIGPVAAIGVDLEPQRTVRLDTRRRELIIGAAIAVADGVDLPDSDDARILQAWARLEAWGKADGRGIGRTLRHFGIWGGGGAHAPVDLGARKSGALVVHDVEAGAGLFAAVALPRGVSPPKLLFMPTDLPSLLTILAASGPGANSGVDLAPGAGQKGSIRSVAQPG